MLRPRRVGTAHRTTKGGQCPPYIIMRGPGRNHGPMPPWTRTGVRGEGWSICHQRSQVSSLANPRNSQTSCNWLTRLSALLEGLHQPTPPRLPVNRAASSAFVMSESITISPVLASRTVWEANAVRLARQARSHGPMPPCTRTGVRCEGWSICHQRSQASSQMRRFSDTLYSWLMRRVGSLEY